MPDPTHTHTPGKLSTGLGGWLFTADGSPFICNLDDRDKPTLDLAAEKREDLRRIAAAWNLVDGVPTALIERAADSPYGPAVRLEVLANWMRMSGAE